ncbi:MAG: M15 family metallopeptidase [Cyclobacteriaceae bacterium]|nr:M15 family metallopeptidase [Cyclobacteriaceae bacterium]
MRLLTFFILAFIVEAKSQPVDKNYLLGKFDPATHSQFVKLADEHTRGSGRGGYLRKETYEAFLKMSAAARQEGIELTIISATRNFDSQKRIWENKWNGKVPVEGKDLTTVSDLKERARLILLYSSMPSTSRHHWGTDMDLNALENSYFESGEGLKIYTWLKAHAAEYGFCQPYTSKTTGRSGYEEERWHWSYLPLSGEFLNQYTKQVSYKDISGFAGSDIAKQMAVIKNYVEGVACKK